MSNQKDLMDLKRLSDVVNDPLRLVLKEILPLVHSVVSWIPVGTSGSAVCRYGLNGVRQYEVRYQVGDLGNLVHEMTHVAVNESYGLDFLNYPNWHAVNVPKRNLDGSGRCLNEEDRQTKQMNQGMNTQLSGTLSMLKKWVDASTELTVEQRANISNKLVYGMMNPHKESHTVMNQILMWMFEWGYPIIGNSSKKPVVNAFYEELSKAVKIAYDARQAAKPRALIHDAAKIRRRAMGYEE